MGFLVTVCAGTRSWYDTEYATGLPGRRMATYVEEYHGYVHLQFA